LSARGVEALGHLVERRGEDLELVVGAQRDAPAQAALGELARPRRQGLERPQALARQRHRGGHAEQQSRRSQPEDVPGRGAHRGAERVVIEGEDHGVAVAAPLLDQRRHHHPHPLARRAARLARGRLHPAQRLHRRRRGGRRLRRAFGQVELLRVEELDAGGVEELDAVEILVERVEVAQDLLELGEAARVVGLVGAADRLDRELRVADRALLDLVAQLAPVGEHLHQRVDRQHHPDQRRDGDHELAAQAASCRQHALR
jgi:hypothetical protein